MDFSFINSNGKRELESSFLELQLIDKQQQEIADEVQKLMRHNKTLEARRLQILDIHQTYNYAANMSYSSKAVFNNNIFAATAGYSMTDSREDDPTSSPSRGGGSRLAEAPPRDLHNAKSNELSTVPTTEWTSQAIHMESTIINNSVTYEKWLKTWLASVQRTSKPELIFRASRDGWDAKDFHRHCVGKGATITVIKTSKGHIFGGYTPTPWTRSRNGCYKRSNEAFLFVLKCAQKMAPFKMNIIKGKESKATYHCTQHGPSFGSGSDLHSIRCEHCQCEP